MMNEKTIYALADEINQVLFDGMLDLTELKIYVRTSTHRQGWLGYYLSGKIRIYAKDHKNSYTAMINTLAHELVHFYQDMLECPTNHNGKIFRYYTAKWRRLTGYDFSENVK